MAGLHCSTSFYDRLGVFLFGISLAGSFSLLLFILSMAGARLIISTVSRTQQQAILGAFTQHSTEPLMNKIMKSRFLLFGVFLTVTLATFTTGG